jgi:hypothetical protein
MTALQTFNKLAKSYPPKYGLKKRILNRLECFPIGFMAIMMIPLLPIYILVALGY